jgi:hypothetical protein
MRRSHAAAALLAGTVLLAPVHSVRAAGATQGQIDRIVKELRANAELWWNDQDIKVEPEVALKTVWFDKASIPYLTQTIRSMPTDPNGLYVINRLLRRLSFARTDAIRAALPTVKDLHSKLKNSYKPFLQLSKRQVEALKKPSSNSAQARAALEERRREKLAKEKVIAKHNQMVYILEMRTFQLMLLAKSPEEDKQLSRWLIEAEKQRSAHFLTIVDAMAADARRMSKERAGKERAEQIYEILRPYGVEVKMQKKTAYVDRGKSTVRPDDISTYEVRQEYPGIRILSMLNRIATAARTPALKVPKAKEIEKYHKDRAKKRRTRPRT